MAPRPATRSWTCEVTFRRVVLHAVGQMLGWVMVVVACGALALVAALGWAIRSGWR